MAAQLLKLRLYTATVIHSLQPRDPASRVPGFIFALGFYSLLPKDKVYNCNPQMEELKENIYREIATIPAEQLHRVNQNLFCWHEECLCVERQHFQHLL
jgi:hypothetical protein